MDLLIVLDAKVKLFDNNYGVDSFITSCDMAMVAFLRVAIFAQRCAL